MKHVGYITVPIYELDEGHYTGFRQNMLTLDDGGERVAAVSSGGGLGTDCVWLERATEEATEYTFVHGRDLMAARMAMVDPGAAKMVPTTEAFGKESG